MQWTELLPLTTELVVDDRKRRGWKSFVQNTKRSLSYGGKWRRKMPFMFVTNVTMIDWQPVRFL